MKQPRDIDEYIASFPKDTQEILEQFRITVKRAAPQAEEVISYGMPAFKLNGMLVWFAAHTSHTGFYPRISGIEAFRKELSNYKVANGSVQFPFNKPFPLELITKIVKFKARENLANTKQKKRTPA